MSYLQGLTRRKTPQNERMLGRPEQVENNAGGFVWKIDDFARLRRFLILGSEGGTYYQGQHELSRENAEVVLRCADTDLGRTVDEILRASTGAAPKNDESLFALALLASHKNPDVRRVALVHPRLRQVVRTGSHLLQFVSYLTGLRGWSRGLRTAIGDWYLNQAPLAVAYQVAKYRSRHDWSHRDILRQAHPKHMSPSYGYDLSAVFDWVTHGEIKKPDEADTEIVEYLGAVDALRKTRDVNEAVGLIENHNLTLDMVPKEILGKPKVLRALMWKMPMTALLRNLANLTRHEVLKPLTDETRHVVDALTDRKRIRQGRLHPVSVLIASLTYGAGKSTRADTTWQPIQQISTALEDAFNLSFQEVPETGARYYIGLDVSSSMTWGAASLYGNHTDTGMLNVPGLSPRVASGAMAMSILRREKNVHVAAFSHVMTDLPLTARDSLADVTAKISGLPFGDTDCALPMLDAANREIPVDVFIIYTDNETWHGKVHPVEALQHYRKQMGIQAKLIVCAMTSTGFSIADPNDGGMLDVVGFDANVPAIIHQFVTGELSG